MKHRRMPWRDLTLGLLAEQAADFWGERRLTFDRPLDIDRANRGSLTYGDYATLVREASGWLHAAGVRSGDKVVVWKRNHVDAHILAFATARIGAVPMLISSAVRKDDAPVLLQRTRPAAIVTDEFTTSMGSLAGLRLQDFAERVISVNGWVEGSVPLDDLIGAGPQAPVAVRGNDEASIVTHTSGTTGVPKLVQYSIKMGGAAPRIESRIPIIGLRADDRVAGAISWVHARSVGLMINIFHNGAEFLACGDIDGRRVPNVLEDFRPTVVEALPNAYLYWDAAGLHSSNAFADTRLFHNTFDAIHPRTVRSFLRASQRRFPLWVESWGQSESGGVTGQFTTRRGAERPAAANAASRRVGRPLPFITRVRVVDPETRKRLPATAVGALEVSTPGLSMTYVGQEDLHAKRRRGKWWTMGDVGFKSRTGVVHLLDREIDHVPGIRSCLELEDVLIDRIPGASEVVVIGIDDKPVTVVSLQRGEIDGDVWRRITAGLPSLALPIVLPWDELPRTGTLKVRRRELREHLIARGLV